MAKYSRLKVLTTMIETGLVPLFYHADIEIAMKLIWACVNGGARVVEFTNRGDQAHEVFRALIDRFKEDEQVILGAGSILDAGTASLYIQLGANFIVGPVLNPEVARVCNRRKITYIPGCGSASEISQAEELGVEICKVFPSGSLGGQSFVKDILGPMPLARIMPTGGIEPTEESLSKWFEAGVACVGISNKLLPGDVIASGNFDSITSKVRQVCSWINNSRAGKSPIK
jgi:2-dehydro-3-deoxyphosphogluconate aldolase/(4S)-4-hydroxy-2-oxoglutarate aldolase